MSDWLISSGSITVELCKTTCLINGFLYAGVQDGYLIFLLIMPIIQNLTISWETNFYNEINCKAR
jgi:hypothetical protein